MILLCFWTRHARLLSSHFWWKTVNQLTLSPTHFSLSAAMSQIEMVLSKSETTTVYLLLILSLLRLCSGVETLRGGLDSPVGGHDGAKPPPSDHLSHFEEDVTHVERGKDTLILVSSIQSLLQLAPSLYLQRITIRLLLFSKRIFLAKTLNKLCL